MTDLRAAAERIFGYFEPRAELCIEVNIDYVESVLREVAMEPSDDHRLHYRVGGCTQCLEESLNQDLRLVDALKQARSEALEQAAKLIEDWHVPRQGGTHEMAFQIRALKP